MTRNVQRSHNSFKRVLEMELAIIIAVFVGWFVLNRWLLPKMGVST